jgi:hypothetical protein
MMLEWPGRCCFCNQPIEDWSDAGYQGRRWIHKSCWVENNRQEEARGKELPSLRPPTDRSSQLELPMLTFLLMFHFGLGAAVAGWIMLTQGADETVGVILLIVGIITPIIGVAGVAANIISRRRIELIRQDLDTQGGWKPGR